MLPAVVVLLVWLSTATQVELAPLSISAPWQPGPGDPIPYGKIESSCPFFGASECFAELNSKAVPAAYCHVSSGRWIFRWQQPPTYFRSE